MTNNLESTNKNKFIKYNENNILFAKINNPKALNAMDEEILNSLHSMLDEISKDDNIFAIFLEGEGRAFCSGDNVIEAYKRGKNSTPYYEIFEKAYKYFVRLSQFNKPYISLLDGITMGGGAGISMFGSYKIATENTLFAMPETNIGFFTDAGSAFFMKHLPLSLILYLCLTGSRISGADCINLKLATHYIKSKNINLLKQKLDKHIWKTNESKSLQLKRILDSVNEDFEREEVTLTTENLKLIYKYFDAPDLETIFVRLKEDGCKNNFASETYKKLCSYSSMSLKVIFHHIVTCQNMNISDCAKQEYRIMTRMLNNYDFYEGVRAQLIDKDKKPNWKYKKLAQATKEEVDKYFLPLNKELF